MNINLIKLKGVVSELHGIRTELSRIADAMEADLIERRIYSPKVDTSGPEPTMEYVDEEMDYVREFIKQLKDDEVSNEGTK